MSRVHGNGAKVENILVYSPWPPSPGGGALASREILVRLSNRFHFTVVTYTSGQEIETGIEMAPLGLGTQTAILRGLAFFVKGLCAGLKSSKKLRPGLVSAKNLITPGITASLVSRILGKPLLLHTSGHDVQNPVNVGAAYGSKSLGR